MPIQPTRSKSDGVLVIIKQEDSVLKPKNTLKKVRVAPFDLDEFKSSAKNSFMPIRDTPSVGTLVDLQNAFILSQVYCGFGGPFYKIFDEANAIATINRLRHLIESGVINVNAPIVDSDLDSRYAGYPILAAAAREANLPVVKELLKLKNIDLCARDNRTQDAICFRTVLMHAVRGALFNGTVDVIELLLSDERILPSLNVSSVSIIDGSKHTALNLAVEALAKDPESTNCFNIIKLLCDYEAIAL